jgi:hypothetical protein
MRKDDGDKDDDPVHILDRLTQTLWWWHDVMMMMMMEIKGWWPGL